MEPPVGAGAAVGLEDAADARGARRRPRLPRPPLRPAAPGRAARVGHPRLPPAQPPARPAPAPLGGSPDRGARGEPVRDLHEDPPFADRRRQRDAADPARAHDRSRPARHAGVLDGWRRKQGRARARARTGARSVGSPPRRGAASRPRPGSAVRRCSSRVPRWTMRTFRRPTARRDPRWAARSAASGASPPSSTTSSGSRIWPTAGGCTLNDVVLYLCGIDAAPLPHRAQPSARPAADRRHPRQHPREGRREHRDRDRDDDRRAGHERRRPVASAWTRSGARPWRPSSTSATCRRRPAPHTRSS